MTDQQAGDLPRDDESATDRPPSTATPLTEGNEQLKSTRPLQDDDASLLPDAKRRRTDAPGGAAAVYEVAGAALVPSANHQDDPSTSSLAAVKSTPTGAIGLDVKRNQIKEELEDALRPTTQASSAENVAEAISHLLDQTRRVEDASKQQVGHAEPSNSTFLKANSNLKLQSLPILDNLSTQMLCFVARTNFQDLSTLVLDPQSENAQSYSTLRSLFDHTKKVYTTTQSFLSASDLGFTDSSQVEIIRKANLASFVFSLFGTQEIGLSDLHDHFLDIFVPEGGRLLKSQAALFLELKTQTFIAAMNNPARPKADILYELFPDNLGVKLLARRPGTRHPAPSETDFVKRAWSRRDILLGEINNPDSANTLSEKYLWQDFLRDVSIYVSKNIDSITTQQAKRSNKIRSPTSPQEEEIESPGIALETQFPVAPPNPPEPAPVERRIGKVDLVARAARAAQIALQGQGSTHLPFLQSHFQFQQYSPQVPPEPSAIRANAASASYGYMPGVPHYSQSEPTQILYERARLATTTRSSPSSRRAGLPSQRRPWTTEEENALMAGLDRVKGPHWSQILSMFGPGGTISEALKDRNQVQLKDKARNLKLFFLKSGIEVPYYLKFVTGELKTRAPAQAAKQEARERERQQGEEDKAHVEGIEGMMALAGAHASASVEPSIGSIESHPNTQPSTPVVLPQQQEMHHQPDQDQHSAERSAEQVLYQSLTQDQKSDSMQMDSQRNYVDPSL
ncbi:telomeric DNA-binding factor trf1 [Arthroderma uncinatum]|uniref:telomeric DNA-binding factor trf1 n=1 Tax=Arthroderma uncinatum TaxID=74035 RepID=UPI00144AE3D8|nr:telomeric DNA-binding factor trf1 [Arthroderma uncinatum]KAF3483136.1 telomeric DNA-binding factor trf1 [Arthroderma uncinatum]